jgi:hypothetical protein
VAKVRTLTDGEMAHNLKSFMDSGAKMMHRLKVEFDASRDIYQGVQNSLKGTALDVGALSYLLSGPKASTDDDVRIDCIELIRANLFLHSKLCISDPVVTARTYSNDVASKNGARYAENVILHVRNHTDMQEKLESGPYLDVVVCGTGVVYTGWDSNAGEVLDVPKDFDPDRDEFTMQGDYDIRSVDPRRFLINPSATTFYEADDCVEEVILPFKQALLSFPDHEEALRDWMKTEDCLNIVKEIDPAITEENVRDVVLYHYWERARPWNAMLGSHVVFIDKKQPKILKREKNPYAHGELPYDVITDIDVQRNAYGMSRNIYAAPLQDCCNTLYSLVMQNVELHGSLKLLLPEGGLSDKSTNNPKDVIFFNAATNGKPDYLRPSPVTSDIWRLRDYWNSNIERLYGMSEFSQGQIPRELSSYAVQMSIETDDKFRIRLFNKKKKLIKGMYEKVLSITKQFVVEKRKLKIVGQENLASEQYFSSLELEGDYGIFVDYGMYLPADPAARKQQILELVKSGIFEKAGGNMRKLVSILVDGDMIDIRDHFEKAKIVQDNETTRMIDGQDIPVEDWHEHLSHIESIQEFQQTEFFENLEPELKQKIDAHKKAHTQVLAKLQADAQQPGAPTQAPAGGGEPNPPVPTGGGPAQPPPVNPSSGPVV